MAIPSAITHKIIGINIFPYTLWCYKICKNNIFFSLEEAHSSERKLGLSPKQYFCYREDYLIQWNKQNEKPTSTYSSFMFDKKFRAFFFFFFFAQLFSQFNFFSIIDFPDRQVM